MRALVLSIDLDSPTEYAAIHGVPITAEDPHLMYRAPLRRFEELCWDVGGPGTVFAVARDLCGPAATALGELAEDGFEIACHSWAHDYALSRRGAGTIAKDLRQARTAFREELGFNPAGFRAPGYNLSRALLDEVESMAFEYDSSVLPSPTYYLAKVAVLATYWIAARPSQSILGSARAATAPRQPYHPGHDPYAPGERRLVELPIAVATPARLPLTGATLVLAPPVLRSLMVRSLAGEDVVVVNLHGMDLADADRDGIPPAIRDRQPELRVPIEERMRRLTETLSALAADRSVEPAAKVARAHGARARGGLEVLP